MTGDDEAEIDVCFAPDFRLDGPDGRELDYLGLKACFTALRGPSMSCASHVACDRRTEPEQPLKGCPPKRSRSLRSHRRVTPDASKTPCACRTPTRSSSRPRAARSISWT
jgi:hypothetical protein